VSLIVFTAVIALLLATPGMVPLQILLAATAGIALWRRRSGDQLLVEQKNRRAHAAHSRRPLPRGELTALETWCRGAAAASACGCSCTTERADDVAYAGHFVGYAVVYTVILNRSPAEHRDRRASARMPPCWAGRGDRPGLDRTLAVPDHLRLDAAAFLVARAVRTDDYAKRACRCCP